MNQHSQIPVKISRRDVKHARLKVRENAGVELVIPTEFSLAEIESLLVKKAEWINEKQEIFNRSFRIRKPLSANEMPLFGETFSCVEVRGLDKPISIDKETKVISYRPGKGGVWYRKLARDYLGGRTQELAKRHGFHFGRVFVKAQRTRWGNCSPKRNISLNSHLMAAPEFVIDYVILHELMHTRVPNHGNRFWVHLKAICPRYGEAIIWLQRNKPSLDPTGGNS